MASTQKLQIIIDAQNKADAVLSEVSTRLGGLRTSAESLKPAFEKMALVGTAAFAGISAIIYKATEAAGEAQQVQAQLNAVLKSTHGAAGLYIEDLNDQAAALQKLTTYGDEAINSAQSLLLTFTNIKGPVFQQATQTILDMSTALGQDLKSSSIQVGKALNDPILGVSALRKVGVSFTKDQEDVIKKLVETGHTVEAQTLILKELNTEFGGSAAAAADTFAGRMQQVKNQVGDLFEAIGYALIPKIQELLEKIQPVIQMMIEWATAHPQLIAGLLAAGLAVSALVAGVGFLGLVLPAVITGFGFLAIAIGAISFPMVLLTAAIIAIVALVVWWVKNWSENVESMKELWGGFKDYFIGVWDSIKTYFSEVWVGIKIIFGEAIDWMLAKIQPILNAIERVKSGFSSAVGGASNVFSSVGNFLTGRASGGPVTAGRSYIVGEHGPETFTPNTYGRITSAGAGNGASIILNITGNSFLGKEDVARTIGQEIMNRLRLSGRIS